MKRKPLVRFETTGAHAQLISDSSSMSPRRRRSGGRKKARRTSSKARVIKGRLNLRVAGYTGVQKIAPSSIIPYLPLTKLRAAAKRVLQKTKAGNKKITRRRRGGRRRASKKK